MKSCFHTRPETELLTEEKLTVQYGKEILTIVKLNRDLKTN